MVWLGRIVLAAVLLVAGAAAYEWGTSELGLPRLAIGSAQFDRNYELNDLRRRYDSLRTHIQVLETARVLDQEAYGLIEADLQQLSQYVLQLQREVQFYEGIISPQDGTAGLRIQRLQVLEHSQGRYLLRLVLVQALNHEQFISGDVRVHLNGLHEGEPVRFTLEDLAPEGTSAIGSFFFRYYQELGQEVLLPADLTVESIDVELLPVGVGHQPVRDTFGWQESLQREGF